MKILHLIKTSDGGNWALRQMRELVRHGVEVHVAIPKKGSLIQEYQKHGIKVHYIDYSLRNFLKMSHRLRSVVEEIQPDLIHSHFVITTLIARICLRDIKIPRIFQVPGPLHLENFWTRNIEILLANKEDHWVASCSWTKERYIKSGIDRKKVGLAFYGNDFLHVSEEHHSKGKLYRLLNIPPSSKIIGLVAYMYPPKKYLGYKRGIKGHEDFIDAIELLSETDKDICGVCIGGAWNGALKYEQSVKDYAKNKRAKIYFTGSRSDVDELYRDLYCVVHPSLSENLGGAAESLSLGVPTISSDVGGFPDIVINNQTGLLVKPKDPEGIADAIRVMLRNPEKAAELARNGRELVSKMLKTEETAMKVLEIYHNILNHE